jgi:Fe-S cluster assembly iron-binding protein IscA
MHDGGTLGHDPGVVVRLALAAALAAGAVVEFEDNLMRSAFQVAANPNAEASCGCGSSFTAKL